MTKRERLADLLADRATQGLGEEESMELAGLLVGVTPAEAEAFDRAAAAVDLATAPQPFPPLSAELRSRLEADMVRALITPKALTEETSPTPPPPLAVTPPVAAVPTLPARRSVVAWSGWFAAAACLLLAITAFVTRPRGQVAGVAASEQRQALLASAKDIVRIPWSATKDAAGADVTGDIVWSNAEQKGYMFFSGLHPNDPTATQYQLWIFDKNQDARFPIDGGVFDITANGDVVVPIVAKIKVTEPTMFAVTVEKPGGVVVSTREHVVVLASRT
jgi:hypothetical protein